MTAFSFFRLRDGKVYEYQYWVDRLGNYYQLHGLELPAPISGHVVREVAQG
jgi:hypothetical protein